MSDIIDSEEDAVRLGYKVMSGADLERERERILRGILLPMVTRNCAVLNPGDKCFESPCRNGEKIIMFCDGSNGCTRGVVVRC